jgi:hypothetical protein
MMAVRLKGVQNASYKILFIKFMNCLSKFHIPRCSTSLMDTVREKAFYETMNSGSEIIGWEVNSLDMSLAYFPLQKASIFREAVCDINWIKTGQNDGLLLTRW